MGKAFIIPDVHLKPWMFQKAEEKISGGEYDHIVCLGDIVDDWGQGFNLDLYEETLDALADFAADHSDMLFCYGNHDISYKWGEWETGYSPQARETVLKGFKKLKSVLPAENIAFIHRIDNVLFSHAGLTELFVKYFYSDKEVPIDVILKKVNSLGKKSLWADVSPIWARPQNRILKPYSPEYFQVVGHTPVKEPLLTNNILTLDTFSTYSDGFPIGDQRFVWVDTVEKTWDYTR